MTQSNPRQQLNTTQPLSPSPSSVMGKTVGRETVRKLVRWEKYSLTEQNKKG